MSDFEVHWNRVHGPARARLAGPERSLCAIWPVPVNLDACFEAAGCTTFDDHDDEWDRRAEELLDRLLLELSSFGEPRLLTEPLRTDVPWYARPFRQGETLELREQLLQPIHWDSLPRCRVAFGAAGHEVVAGDGHHIYWLAMPGAEDPQVPPLVARIAGPWPLRQTQLKFEHLLGLRQP